MYQRKNATPVLPTTNGSGYSPGGYRPNYPAPPSYASGMASSDTISSKSRKNKKSSVPQWALYAVIVFLGLAALIGRIQVRNLLKKLDRANNVYEQDKRRNEAMYGRGGRRDPDSSKELMKIKKELDSANRLLNNKEKEIEIQKQKVREVEHEKQDLMEELEHHHIHHHGGDMGKDSDETGDSEGPTLTEKLNKMEEREVALYERIGSLQAKIQRESYREVVER